MSSDGGASASDEALGAGTVKVEKPPTWPKHFGGVLPPWASGGGTYQPPAINFITEVGEPGEGGAETHVVRFRPTSCQEATHPGWATPAGNHTFAQTEERGCKIYHVVQVSSDVSAKIVKAEKEHITDLDRAFDMVFGKVRDCINELANDLTPFTGATVAEAKEKALKKLSSMYYAEIGKSESAWKAAFKALGILTKTLRDDAGLHTVNKTQNGKKDPVNAYGVGKLYYDAVPKIAFKSSADVIKWQNVK